LKEVLIMGGTRFVGKRLVKLYLDNGYSVTIASRRVIGNIEGLTQCTGEREGTIKMLRGLKFDLVIDFTAYNYSDVSKFFSNINCDQYILISSSWVSQFESGDRVFDRNQLKYIHGKIDAEGFLSESVSKSTSITIMRFPIILGLGDASGRLDYYASRLYQKLPIILPNGGINKTKICYADDAALLLLAISNAPTSNSFQVFDGLPRDSISVFNLVNIIGDSLNLVPKIIKIDLDKILYLAPEFLDGDPFYQETKYTDRSLNIFEMFEVQSRPYSEWIRECLLSYTPGHEKLKNPLKSYKWEQIKFRELERFLANANAH